MFDDGPPTCDVPDCDRSLAADPQLVYRTPFGERRAYECDCGAVTIAVAATTAPDDPPRRG